MGVLRSLIYICAGQTCDCLGVMVTTPGFWGPSAGAVMLPGYLLCARGILSIVIFAPPSIPMQELGTASLL